MSEGWRGCSQLENITSDSRWMSCRIQSWTNVVSHTADRLLNWEWNDVILFCSLPKQHWIKTLTMWFHFTMQKWFLKARADTKSACFDNCVFMPLFFNCCLQRSSLVAVGYNPLVCFDIVFLLFHRSFCVINVICGEDCFASYTSFCSIFSLPIHLCLGLI